MASPADSPTVRIPRSPSLVLADVVSYGYAFAVIAATFAWDLAFDPWQGVVIVLLFGVLRYVAHEIRRELRREALREAKRLAALRERSPSRWTVEQRDGIGRALDVSA